MSGKHAGASELARVRQAYEFGGSTLRDIAQRYKRSTTTVIRWVRLYGWTRQGQAVGLSPTQPGPPVRTFVAGQPCPGLAACPFRSAVGALLIDALLARATSLVERPLEPAAFETDTRLIGLLAQTLDRLRGLDLKEAGNRAHRDAPGTDGDDAAEAARIKSELVRRLARLANAEGA